MNLNQYIIRNICKTDGKFGVRRAASMLTSSLGIIHCGHINMHADTDKYYTVSESFDEEKDNFLK
jgi:hypothetical protein